MSGLVLRMDSDTEHVLRSVGDPPNGIISVEKPVNPELPVRFVVDPHTQPSTAPLPPGTARAMVGDTDDGTVPGGTPLTAAQAVEAAADDEACLALWVIACHAVTTYAQHSGPAGEFEDVMRAAAFGLEVRLALYGH